MLSIYKPKCKELWFKQQMMSDAETMSYNHAYGGTIPFPEEKWQKWHEKWIANCDGKRYYRYLKNDKGVFVGEISYNYDDNAGKYMADVVIFARYRGKGYGSQALKRLCSISRRHGITELYDEIAIDNPAVAFFKKKGFSEEYYTKETVMLKKNL